MKKIMIAALGLSLLSGTAVFAQNTSGDSGTMKGKKTHHKKQKKDKSTGDTATSK
jgi:opacity protein-like surface antigen